MSKLESPNKLFAVTINTVVVDEAIQTFLEFPESTDPQENTQVFFGISETLLAALQEFQRTALCAAYLPNFVIDGVSWDVFTQIERVGDDTPGWCALCCLDADLKNNVVLSTGKNVDTFDVEFVTR